MFAKWCVQMLDRSSRCCFHGTTWPGVFIDRPTVVDVVIEVQVQRQSTDVCLNATMEAWESPSLVPRPLHGMRSLVGCCATKAMERRLAPVYDKS